MRIAIEYIRLCLFFGAALIGVQVPIFVEQYGQRLQSHALESNASLREFQADADRYFKGDIEKLVEHYRNSGDRVFVDGGISISAIASRNDLLVASLERFNASQISAYQATFLTPIKDIREEAWSNYDHSIRLKPISIVWALSLGALVALLCEITLKVSLVMLRLASSIIFRSSPPKAKRSNTEQTGRSKAPPTL